MSGKNLVTGFENKLQSFEILEARQLSTFAQDLAKYKGDIYQEIAYEAGMSRVEVKSKLMLYLYSGPFFQSLAHFKEEAIKLLKTGI